MKVRKVEIKWIAGHNGELNNERCDCLARSAREQKQTNWTLRKVGSRVIQCHRTIELAFPTCLFSEKTTYCGLRQSLGHWQTPKARRSAFSRC